MAGKRRGNSEGTITQRADGRWEARYTDAAGKRRCLYGKTRQQVAARLAAAIRDRDRGLLVADARTTVEQYLKTWLETMRPPRIRESTWLRLDVHLRKHAIPAIGRVKLQQLNRMHLQQLYAQCLTSGLSPTTVNHLHGALHQALKDAVRSDLVQRNVAELADPPRVAKRETPIATPEQVDTLLGAARGHRLEALLVLEVATGLRNSELLALKWSHVDLTSGILHVQRTRSRTAKGYIDERPKTESGRRDITLIPLAIDALREHRKRQIKERLALGDAWKDEDRVFPMSNGRGMDASNLDKQWDKLRAKAGLPDEMHFHDLRHSAASWLISKGVPLTKVSKMLGHADPSITLRIYAHSLPGDQADVAAAMEQILGRPTPPDQDHAREG
jgi:integrase